MCHIPDIEIGDICNLGDIFDGNGNESDILENNSYSELITHDDEDGNGNLDIWINYRFDVLEKKEDIIQSIIKIIGIELL